MILEKYSVKPKQGKYDVKPKHYAGVGLERPD